MTATILSAKPRLGISACLLGEPVRFNGGHRHEPLCTRLLAELFDWQPLCPELGAGLAAPRPALRLVASDCGRRVRGSRDPALDITEALQAQAAAFLAAHPQLAGFVFMQKSPSCGLARVPVYRATDDAPLGHDAGGFAAAIRRLAPDLPCEEAGRLHDAGLREHFVLRVQARHRWLQLQAAGVDLGGLLAFYSRYKYQLMAHSPAGQKALGRWLATARSLPAAELQQGFARRFFDCLATPASRGRHANVLEHLRGYLRGLQAREQQRLGQVIAHYRQGAVARIVPLTLLCHHFDRQPNAYVEAQTYLNPYPDHLGLMNGV